MSPRMFTRKLAHAAPRRTLCGVSLIEVLIALVVISIGLLGVAKMQALAIASTRVSSVRSLIAIEAASLASAMHANGGLKGYWGTAAASLQVTVTGNAITSSTDSALTAATTDCTSAVCVGAPMAAYDLRTWGSALQAVIPGSTGQVACSVSPVTCTIQVNWTENVVNLNDGASYSSTSPTTNLSYTLLVQP